MEKYKSVAGGITAVKGFISIGIHAGLKKKKKDLALIVGTSPTIGAGVFTTNKVKAAPLTLSMKHLKTSPYVKGVVINSGNANACTGEQGDKDAYSMAKALGDELNANPEEILVASTGVIGVEMPIEKIIKGIKEGVSKLSKDGASLATEAIMTTDTFPKELSFEFIIGDKKVTMGGMTKGSGMIEPNMATMLGFITTDINISKDLLQDALIAATNKSFNMITVDGDTSTNDMVILLANALADNPKIESKDDSTYKGFLDALTKMSIDLAKLIAKDGEGATKLVTVEIVGADTEKDAQVIAKSIANSNLVKTAIFGEDANWGRILAAIGYSGAEFDPEKVSISFKNLIGEEIVAKDGRGINFSEENAKKILQEKEITIYVDLGRGQSSAIAWTCDLSYDYIKINADYRS